MSTKTAKAQKTTESLQRKVAALAASPDTDAEAIKVVVGRLLACPAPKDAGRPEFELKVVKVCLERRGELASDEEENPLDDDEKLRAVRIAVFGSAPSS